MDKGTHIKVRRGWYSHHGIYVGNGAVIHLDKPHVRVKETSLDDFLNGGKLEVVRSVPMFPPDVIVERARLLLGRSGYNALFSNCEHFANWCRTGEARSRQAECVMVVTGLVILALLILPNRHST